MKTINLEQAKEIVGATKMPTRKSNAAKSVIDLFNYGHSTTGQSGYSKGWSNKSIWTAETVRLAKEYGLTVEFGNDAPRGGASGEYVKLVDDKRKNKKVHNYRAAFILLNNEQRRLRELESSKEEARKAAFKDQVHQEADMYIPFLTKETFATTLTGEEKSKLFASRMKGMIEQAGQQKIASDFWQVVRILKSVADNLKD